jgi:hypothetical protein
MKNFSEEQINTILKGCNEERFTENIKSLATVGCDNDNAGDICFAIEFLFELKEVVNHFRELRGIK